jgi:hypothetical protein
MLVRTRICFIIGFIIGFCSILGCPIKKRIVCQQDDFVVESCDATHIHSIQARTRGISAGEKRAIDVMLQSGVTAPKQILHQLSSNDDIEHSPESSVLTYIHRKKRKLVKPDSSLSLDDIRAVAPRYTKTESTGNDDVICLGMKEINLDSGKTTIALSFSTSRLLDTIKQSNVIYVDETYKLTKLNMNITMIGVCGADRQYHACVIGIHQLVGKKRLVNFIFSQ